MDIILGYYGRTPAPVDPTVQAIAAKISGKEPISERPADILKPMMPTFKSELKSKNMPATDEYAVIHAMFPQELSKYWKNKDAPKTVTPFISAHPKDSAQAVLHPTGKGRVLALTIEGKEHEVRIEELG
jgi:oxaloacetate decarboxylase alpha subunit/pyruvate carboxylase subunit B